jgi:hypothetical protein
MRILCSIITEPIRRLASELGTSDSYANNLVNTWRTLYNKNVTDIPKKSDILDLHLKDKENIYLAIPNYEKEDYSEGGSLAYTKGNIIHLRKVFDTKPLDYFFDYILGNVEGKTSKQKKEIFKRLANVGYALDKVKELISNPTEAYRFLLWHEMSHVEYNDVSNYYKVEREKHGGWDNLPSDLK